MATDAAEPKQTSRSPKTSRANKKSNSKQSPPRAPPRSPRTHFSIPSSEPSTSSNIRSANYTTGSSYKNSSSATSISSLSSLRESLPETAHIYDFTEICAATNNFLAKKYSSSSASWRCTIRGRDAVVFQRKFRRPMEKSQLRERLSVICRSHHMSIIKLLGASISGQHIYLVYEFITGANLANCLRNPKNPSYTVLSTWISRMQVATDLAHGLDYIHNKTGQNSGLVHNHIKSSSIVVTEPSFNARLCHFGTAQLCGEADADIPPEIRKKSSEITEISEEITPENSSSKPELRRSDSRNMQFEGVRGYMSPEFQSNGVPTQKSDVYAFGVVILELLSGEEPLKYKYDKESGDFRRTSVIETAREAIEGGGCAGEGTQGRLRRWIDKRLKDSFPLVVAEKVARVVLECVHVDPDKRPDMQRVAGKISKLYLESRKWSDRLNVPTGISVSLGPR